VEPSRGPSPPARSAISTETFQPAHRPQPRLEPSVIGLDPIVRVPVVDVVGGALLR
jgi:hypothetical protein